MRQRRTILFGFSWPRTLALLVPLLGPAPAHGAAPDEDGDGVVDSLDECLGVKGLPSNAGCPDQDSDGDGTGDRADRCPKAAGPLDNQGCPDLDSDGDGLVDRMDRCPKARGDDARFGCPVEGQGDADGDGVVDARDACPDKAETNNKYLDEDGCPDAVPAELKAYVGRVKGVDFEARAATLTPSSRTALAKIAKAMLQLRDVRLQVVGYPDPRGEWEEGVLLAGKRAAAVMDELLKGGVEPARVTRALQGSSFAAPAKGREAAKAFRPIELRWSAMDRAATR